MLSPPGSMTPSWVCCRTGGRPRCLRGQSPSEISTRSRRHTAGSTGSVTTPTPSGTGIPSGSRTAPPAPGMTQPSARTSSTSVSARCSTRPQGAFEPRAWAKLFAQAGVRYVVLVSKHHDGWTLWPSATPNPFLPGWHATRDLVGELGVAVRAQGLRYGLYYSGGLDWTFEPGPIRDLPSLMKCIPQSAQYLAYANAHWRELIARYAPCVMWNDIGYPREADLVQLFADYYAAVPDGVVNDRFVFGRQPHLDFNTPEYSAIADIYPRKWELTRGIGLAFGYNRNETPATFPLAPRARAPALRRRQQERKPSARRGSHARRHDSRAAARAAARPRTLARRLRRSDLRHPALATGRGSHERRHAGALHAKGRRALRARAWISPTGRWRSKDCRSRLPPASCALRKATRKVQPSRCGSSPRPRRSARVLQASREVLWLLRGCALRLSPRPERPWSCPPPGVRARACV